MNTSEGQEIADCVSVRDNSGQDCLVVVRGERDQLRFPLSAFQVSPRPLLCVQLKVKERHARRALSRQICRQSGLFASLVQSPAMLSEGPHCAWQLQAVSKSAACGNCHAKAEVESLATPAHGVAPPADAFTARSALRSFHTEGLVTC